MRGETFQGLGYARSAAQELVELTSDRWESIRIGELAFERLLINLGEALSRVRNTGLKALDHITVAHKFISMRNALVQGYAALDTACIQAAIVLSLPLLTEEFDQLLSSP
jgi:uncharacterized protein with HEPN domain